ncbi:uncharacterized protein TNIN_279821 [Trichonephila inaurata madagascariensis]|uniref:Uncharacterized protein n=1 Tax=Trichonephila inaurata madagascariensis TaxID=2747483 RepID=A0A8X7C1R0_9ARAC|nr:uncharacterized protein TNIN_279821 [Trichonephila inaurata madagascariensis]
MSECKHTWDSHSWLSTGPCNLMGNWILSSRINSWTYNNQNEICSELQGFTKTSSSEFVESDVEMGNGSSHSIVLGPPRFQSSDYPIRNGYHPDHRGGVPKYVHPQNRVLPKPVAGQRLRSTDNGSILQTAGTIRGQRRDSGDKEEHVDPEVMGILRRRSEMIEKENDCYHHLNLRNHRLFHSDPNIARRPSPCGYANDDMSEGYTNRRSCNGGAAGRASKLKYKKKSRAPDPPPLDNSFPRRPQSLYAQEESRERKPPNGLTCKCINKPRAPQPPAIVVHPPPPPPMPSSVVTTRTKIGSPTASSRTNKEMPSRSQDETPTKSPHITRAVESQVNRMTYEKKIHPLEKWRNCRSTGDIRIDEEEEPSTSRTTIFDSKKISDSQSKLPSYLPQRPDPFQKEIQAVTKKIAESRQQDNSPSEEALQKSSKLTKPDTKTSESNSKPKFYFADPTVFKANSKTEHSEKLKDKKSNSEGVSKSDYSRKESGELQIHENTTVDEIVPSLQRFSPARRRFKLSSGSSTPTPQQKAEKEWDHLSKSLFNKQDAESDIDVRLRPVLPRKPPDVPKFSPSEAWQALGSDGLGSSNHSTSDDGPESLMPYKRGLPHRNGINDRPRRTSDRDYDRYDDGYKHSSMSDSHWTPRQDLLDDSDVSSEDSEEAVVPRMRPGLGEISTRFSLPTVMFSNMRPIGSEIKPNPTQPSFLNDSAKEKQIKKKRNEQVYDNNQGSNFKRFLSKRNKYLSEEDITVSDSNWTFGQYGLQKRGKQYSSDLMLSDKKKYELMVQNSFGDFLGDILVSKANDMRKQMKSSDSGNSNFSFYSTDGQIMYIPEKGGFVKNGDCSPPTKGRVYDMRRRFDAIADAPKPNFVLKNSKKKPNASDFDLSRRRDLELAKMLEDEVRKRRNKEKISIRQQLQRMKHLQSDDEEEDDFDDEAYFTEPKSREESQSPFFSPERPTAASELGMKQSRFGLGASTSAMNSSHLSHWQSSPALLEDSLMKNNMHPSAKGRLSLSSVMSSPDSGAWVQSSGVVDTWLQKQQKMGLDGLKNQSGSSPDGHLTASDPANDGDVSSSPTPAPPKKERRKTNIYKQLMDIVRKEERHLKNAQRGEAGSRDSSYSHRESSPSTCSESSSTSSYSYSDSSSAKNHAKNGVPANKEFGYRPSSAAPSFQVAFVQPYSPSKSYRPVPFDVVPNPYRLPGLQEEGKQMQAEVS